MITRLPLVAAALGASIPTIAEALPLLTSPLAARSGPDRSAWVEPPPRHPVPAASDTGAAHAEKRDSLAAASPAPGATESAPAKAAAAEARVGPVHRAAPVRNIRSAGRDGLTRRTGRTTYAFSGSFGGCRFHGRAGPGGVTIDRSC